MNPKLGFLRGREFIMKGSYDITLLISYMNMILQSESWR